VRTRILALVLLAATTAAADTSPRRGTADPRRFSLLRSFAAPRASLFSADGRYIFSYSADGGTLHDLERNKKIGKLTGHTGTIHDGRFSRDGKLLVTAGYEGTVRIWETKTGTELHSVNSGHAGYA
jgi:WD40 repeat protein